MGEETELKLRVAPEHLRRLRAALRRLSGPPRRERLLSLYYDTPDLALARADHALRIRRVGRRWIQTLKGGGEVSAGLHRRVEQEWALPRPQPDLSRLPLPGLDTASLTQVFATDFWRDTWLIEEAGAKLEAALDRGVIRSGERQEPLLELELELRAGKTEALYAVALRLAADIPLAPEPRAKAERGYALFRGDAWRPVRATLPALSPAQTVEDAFACLFAHAFDHIARNQAGVLTHDDPEFVHQMRVASRRLRALLSLFRPAIPPATWAPWRAGLLDLARALGEVRDWDVLAMEVLPGCVARKGELPRLTQAVERMRRRARQRAREMVGGTAYGVLMLQMGQWLTTRAWRRGAEASRRALLAAPIASVARDWLARRHRKLLRVGRHFLRLDDAQRHRLRVQAKKQRYGAEFLGSLFPHAAWHAYVRHLAKLQDELGELNDLAGAVARVGELGRRTRQPALREEVSRFLAWADKRREKKLAALPPYWKRFERLPPFWEE